MSLESGCSIRLLKNIITSEFYSYDSPVYELIVSFLLSVVVPGGPIGEHELCFDIALDPKFPPQV